MLSPVGFYFYGSFCRNIDSGEMVCWLLTKQETQGDIRSRLRSRHKPPAEGTVKATFVAIFAAISNRLGKLTMIFNFPRINATLLR